MQQTPSAPACRCDDSPLAALARAIENDDLDRAIGLGLLEFAADPPACETCAARACAILAARDARLRALAARERYRHRQVRLAERAQARAQRKPAPMAVTATTPLATPLATPVATPALPPAAAAALARAKAKAAAKRGE